VEFIGISWGTQKELLILSMSIGRTQRERLMNLTVSVVLLQTNFLDAEIEGIPLRVCYADAGPKRGIRFRNSLGRRRVNINNFDH
jgi:hypothetical protein